MRGPRLIFAGMERLDVPLRQQPRVARMGMWIHGNPRRERFRMARSFGMHFYQYAGEVAIDGRTVAYGPGMISVTPPSVELEWTYHQRRAPHYYVHLIFPTHAATDLVAVPILTPAPSATRRAELIAEFERATFDHTREPARASAWAWNLLWSLIPRPRDTEAIATPPAVPASAHPAVRQVAALIEQRLDQRLSLAELAREVHLSREHLIRLFRRHLGTTVAEHLRERRLSRARELLAGSVLPVHAIGRAVGIPDAQRLNKLMRARWGAPPTQLRGR